MIRLDLERFHMNQCIANTRFNLAPDNDKAKSVITDYEVRVSNGRSDITALCIEIKQPSTNRTPGQIDKNLG